MTRSAKELSLLRRQPRRPPRARQGRVSRPHLSRPALQQPSGLQCPLRRKEELLAAKKIDYPRFAADATFKKAPKARKAAEEQMPLGGDIEEPF